MSLQGPGHQAADHAVRGDDVKFVRLLDVDGEVGDGLAASLQLLLGLFGAHVRSELGLTLVGSSTSGMFGQGGVAGSY